MFELLLALVILAVYRDSKDTFIKNLSFAEADSAVMDSGPIGNI